MCSSSNQGGWSYCLVLGLVVGPGCVLGVGLVVLGVSVPMPPALDPEVDAPPDVSPGMPDDELPEVDAPPEVSEDEVPDVDAPPEVPDEESDGMPDDVPPVLLPLDSDGIDEDPPLDEPLPEPPPVMPAHAPSSIAHAMGNIHFVIEHSRLDQKEARTRCAPKELHRECRE